MVNKVLYSWSHAISTGWPNFVHQQYLTYRSMISFKHFGQCTSSCNNRGVATSLALAVGSNRASRILIKESRPSKLSTSWWINCFNIKSTDLNSKGQICGILNDRVQSVTFDDLVCDQRWWIDYIHGCSNKFNCGVHWSKWKPALLFRLLASLILTKKMSRYACMFWHINIPGLPAPCYSQSRNLYIKRWTSPTSPASKARTQIWITTYI